MNKEHKPSEPEEINWIYKAGGVILKGRINENLNLTRALGDMTLKRNKLMAYKD